jgi:hypothetical protein
MRVPSVVWVVVAVLLIGANALGLISVNPGPLRLIVLLVLVSRFALFRDGPPAE